MVVSQYLILGTLIISLCTVYGSFAQDIVPFDDQELSGDIEALNNQMEEHIRNNNLKGLMDLYLKESFLLIPDKTYSGRKEIHKYWRGIKNITEWELEVVEVSQQESVIYDNQYYQALETKPAGWRQRGIELDDDKPLIFQIGRSELKINDDNGKVKNINASVIFVWQVQEDGNYKILLNTYSWE